MYASLTNCCTGRPSPHSLRSGKPRRPCQALLQLDRSGSAGGTKRRTVEGGTRCGPVGLFASIVPWLWFDGGLLARSPPPPRFTSPPFCWCPYILHACQIARLCICV